MGAPKIIKLGMVSEKRADGFETWLDDNSGARIMAILDLEPFDPHHQLTDDQRAEWHGALAEDRWTP